MGNLPGCSKKADYGCRDAEKRNVFHKGIHGGLIREEPEQIIEAQDIQTQQHGNKTAENDTDIVIAGEKKHRSKDNKDKANHDKKDTYSQ